MTSLGQTTLLRHLLDVESLETLAREGLDIECVPAEDLRRVVTYALDYFHESGRKRAPSYEAIQADFETLLSDHDIDINEDPNDSVEWAIDDLKGTYIFKRSQEFNKAFAAEMSEAETAERQTVLAQHASDLVTLSMRMENHESKVDAREAMGDRLQAYHDRVAAGESITGLRLGVPRIDDYTRGIHDGELAVLAAGPKVGKAQPLGSLVMTPTGWRHMGDLNVGDEVTGRDGRPTRVLALHPQGTIPIYRVTTSDGACTEASGDHLWRVSSHGNGLDRVLTTTEVQDELLAGKSRTLYLPMVDPILFRSSTRLPVAPYLLGALLGDGGMSQGSVTLTTADPEILAECAKDLPDGVEARYRSKMTWGLVGARGVPNPLSRSLRDLGLMPGRSHTRFIPQVYLQSRVEDRVALLQGLMDTDGGVEGNRSVSYCTTSPYLKDDLRELVEGLGGTCRVSEKKTQHRLAYVLRLRLPSALGAPFRLPRKVSRWTPPATHRREPVREIVEVTYVGDKPAQCITVEAADHLYVTEHALVTHNSYMLDRVALSEFRAGRATALYTLENSIEMTLDRIACMAVGVDSRSWQHGECTDDQINLVNGFVEEISASDSPLYVMHPDPGQRGIQEMVRQAQLLDVDSIILDQLTFIEPEDERAPRHLQIREITHDLKSMISSGRQRIPALLAHQINREGVKAADKVGYLEMFHLAEGSEVERTADWVFGLYRSEMERAAGHAKFQTLAVRREENRNFLLTWQIDTGFINVRAEIDREGNVMNARLGRG